LVRTTAEGFCSLGMGLCLCLFGFGCLELGINFYNPAKYGILGSTFYLFTPIQHLQEVIMKNKIIRFFDENPAAIYYLCGVIVLVGSIFVAAVFGYVISMMES
jgi:hypothetical protein